jgi:D-proline reductase (dithiol) PrdB
VALIKDLELTHRLFMKSYRYRSFDWFPGFQLTKPLSEAKLAIITTAAVHLPEQSTFDETERGGDSSFRELSGDVDVSQLKIAHRSSAFDQTGALHDRNLVFPLDRFRELVARGKLGALNHRHFSFMGSIIAPERLIQETAPELAARLRQDQVDVAFLLPV